MGNSHLSDDILRELRMVMGDDFSNLLRTFATDSAARLALIQQTAAAADCDALCRAAHSFKGSAGNMGAVRLSELCCQIEEFARGGALERCLPLVAQLRDEFALVQRELNQLVH